MLSPFVLGATAMAMAVAGLLFLRMWRESRDRLYIMFAAAFWLEALSRIFALGLDSGEAYPTRYVVRVLAYGMIMLAIVDKNIRKR